MIYIYVVVNTCMFETISDASQNNTAQINKTESDMTMSYESLCKGIISRCAFLILGVKAAVCMEEESIFLAFKKEDEACENGKLFYT